MVGWCDFFVSVCMSACLCPPFTFPTTPYARYCLPLLLPLPLRIDPHVNL